MSAQSHSPDFSCFTNTSYSVILLALMAQVLLMKPAKKEFRSVSSMQINGAAFQALRNLERITEVKLETKA